MPENLCKCFQMTSSKTYKLLKEARFRNHQPLEETITDLNILFLKKYHRFGIYSKAFNKIEEGVNGADWEWWISNSSKSSWIGLRVQAKILHLESNRFEHLHYKTKKTKTYQLTKLKNKCIDSKLIPLYCLYLHYPSRSLLHPLKCKSFTGNSSLYGCSIASI